MENIVTNVFSVLNIGDNLYNFYNHFLIKSDFDYIIIVPRKCLTEYKCICSQYKDMKLCDNKFYMTSKSYVRYMDQILNDICNEKDISILIIDDIMLYGRGIRGLLKEMVESLDKNIRDKVISKIFISVFIENANEYVSNDSEWLISAVDDILGNRYNRYYSYGNLKDIHRASDLFLESFYATATSNTSFVNTWYCKSNDFVIYNAVKDEYNRDKDEIRIRTLNELIEKDKGLSYVSMEGNADQKRNKFFSCIYYENIRDLGFEFRCVRVYHNEILKKSFLVPCVFLKPMSGEQIDNFLKELKQIFGFVKLWEELGSSDQAYVLKFEYLTNLLSDCYGAYFYGKYLYDGHRTWDEQFEEETVSAEFSFGREIVRPMDSLCREQTEDIWKKVSDVCNKIVDIEEHTFFKQEEETVNLFEQAVHESDSCEEVIQTVLNKSNMKDTYQAKKGQKKIFGITTLSARTILEQRNNLLLEDWENIYVELIRHCDQGAASLKVETLTINGKKYFGAIINSGEQAYRIFQEPAELVLHYFAKIEENCINLYMYNKIDTKIKEFIRAYEEIRLPDMMSCETLELISQEIYARSARYSDYDVLRTHKAQDNRLKERLERAYDKVTY